MNTIKNKSFRLMPYFLLIAFAFLLPLEHKAQEQSSFTREEILEYLRTKVTHYGQSWEQNAKDMDKLCELVKRRGVSFKYGEGQGMNGFDKEMHEAAGGTTGNHCQLPAVLTANFRSATNSVATKNVSEKEQETDQPGDSKNVSFLIGTWQMGIGATGTSYRTRGSNVYRKDTAIGATAGFLTIKSDGTYIWKVYPNDPPEKYRKGKWRKASEEETKYYEPLGIVLLKAHDNDNWVVTRNTNKDAKGEQIKVVNLAVRALEWLGGRK